MKNKLKTILWETAVGGASLSAIWLLVMWLHRNTPPHLSSVQQITLFLILAGVSTLAVGISSVIVNYDD